MQLCVCVCVCVRKTGIYSVCFFDQHFYFQFICQQAVSYVTCVAYLNDWKQEKKH